MIVFNKSLLKNTFLVDEALSLKDSGFLSNDDFNQIKKASPILKSNKNVLLRIGFFLLGSFLFASVMGLLAWFVFGSGNDSNISIVVLFGLYSIIGIFACEFISKEQYRYGIDDAFIIGTIGSIYGFVFNIINSIQQDNENYYSRLDNFEIYFCITIAIVGLIACLRYCHWISALISLVGATGTFYYLISHFSFGLKLMPFLMMIFAVGLYFLYAKLSDKNRIYYYTNSLVVLKVFSLALFYLSGNYLVVRSLSENLMGNLLQDGQDIPFAMFFWVVTFAVPVFYLFWSILKKDKVFLNIGFITFCFSIFTFRTFYSVLPAEIALTLAGIVVFVFSYFTIKKIKNNESGVTFKPDRNKNTTNLVNLEAVIINSQVNMSQNVDDSPMEFGGGGFSGGGAGDSF